MLPTLHTQGLGVSAIADRALSVEPMGVCRSGTALVVLRMEPLRVSTIRRPSLTQSQKENE
jgi:hypothetical protein